MIYVLSSFLKKSIFLWAPDICLMRHHTGNQRGPGCLILNPPFPFMVHTPPQHLVSLHLSCLINTTELLVRLERFLPSSSSLLLSFSSPFCSSLLSPLAAGRTSIRTLATRHCGASEGSGWKCDDNTIEKKLMKRRREECKRMLGLVDRLPRRSPRAPLLCADVNNGAEVAAEDGMGEVCV